MAIKNHTYRNHMIVLNRIMKKGYTFSEADALTRNVFSNYGDGNGMSIEALTDRILTKAEWLAESSAANPLNDFFSDTRPIVEYYLDHANALLRKTKSGYEISTSEDTFCYNSRQSLIDDIIDTIRVWADDDESARDLLDEQRIPYHIVKDELWAEDLNRDEKFLVEEVERWYDGDMTIYPVKDGTWTCRLYGNACITGVSKDEMIDIVKEHLMEIYDERISEWTEEKKAKDRIGKVEAFYTGGGIWMSAMYVDEHTYYAMDSEWMEEGVCVYDHRSEDQDADYPCQNPIGELAMTTDLKTIEALKKALVEAMGNE